MKEVQFPIYPGERGALVEDLQAALQFLLARGLLRWFDAAYTPSDEELKQCAEALAKEREEQQFGDATRWLVQALRDQYVLGEGSGGAVDETAARLLNTLLGQNGAFESHTGFALRGTVKDRSGRPLVGVVVVGFDRDLRRLQELGRAETDAQGSFEIHYHASSFRLGDTGSQPMVDLILHICRRLSDDKLVPIHVHAEAEPVPAVSSVEVVVPDDPTQQPSEFDRVSGVVMPLLEGQGGAIPESLITGGPPKYADLAAHELTADDVALVVRQTRLDDALVRAWVNAARMQQGALDLLGGDADPDYREVLRSQSWQFFFGWCRADSGEDLHSVLSASAASWLAIHRWAQASNRIPEVNQEQGAMLLGALGRLQR